MVIVFGLVAIIPVFYYSIVYSSESVINSQAQDAADTLAKNADYVYAFGSGSSTKVLITIPQKVTGAAAEGNLVMINLTLSSGKSTIKAATKANVTGSIPTTAGSYNMFLNMTGTTVNIQRV